MKFSSYMERYALVLFFFFLSPLNHSCGTEVGNGFSPGGDEKTPANQSKERADDTEQDTASDVKSPPEVSEDSIASMERPNTLQNVDLELIRPLFAECGSALGDKEIDEFNVLMESDDDEKRFSFGLLKEEDFYFTYQGAKKYRVDRTEGINYGILVSQLEGGETLSYDHDCDAVAEQEEDIEGNKKKITREVLTSLDGRDTTVQWVLIHDLTGDKKSIQQIVIKEEGKDDVIFKAFAPETTDESSSNP